MLRGWWNRLWGGRNAYVVQTNKAPGRKAGAARSRQDSIAADSGSSWTSSGHESTHGSHGDHGGSRFAGSGGHFDGGGASGDWGGSSDSSSDSGGDGGGSSD